MTKIKYFASLLLMVMVVLSCQDDRIPKEESKLIVTTNDVTFTKSGESKSVTVETNASNRVFAIWEGGAWGRVEATKDKVTITVDENTNTVLREAIVKIVTEFGDHMETVSVKQHATETVVETNVDAIEASDKPYEQLVYVIMNAANFDVEVVGNPNWVTATKDLLTHKITVAFAENADYLRRSAELKITSGDASKTIKLGQAPKFRYILPLFDMIFNTDITIVADKEAERGIMFDKTRFVHKLFKLPNNDIYSEYYYVILGSTINTIYASAVPQNREVLFEDQDMAKFYESYGFELIFKDNEIGQQVWWNDEFGVEIDFQLHHGAGQQIYFSKHKTRPDNPENQIFSYPTFDKLPTISKDTPLGSTFNHVIAYENGLKRAELPPILRRSNGILYAIQYKLLELGENSLASLTYMFEGPNSTLSGIKYGYKNVNIGSFRIANAYDTDFMLTKEFEKKLADEGYLYWKAGGISTYYYNPTTEKVMKISVNEAYDFGPKDFELFLEVTTP